MEHLYVVVVVGNVDTIKNSLYSVGGSANDGVFKPNDPVESLKGILMCH